MRDQEALRQTYLYSKGFMVPLTVHEEFRQSGFFIEIMEKFIESACEEEVRRLENEAGPLSAEAADEFWQWNYPVYWEDVFGSRIRSAFCTQLCSQVEATLGTISNRVQVLVRCPVSVKDLKGGGTLEQHRKYLHLFGKFKSPTAQLWDQMNYIFRLRNIFVHEEGYTKEERDRALVTFLSGLPNVKIRGGGFVELRAGSCPALLSIAKVFIDTLFAEYDLLIHRLRLEEDNGSRDSPVQGSDR